MEDKLLTLMKELEKGIEFSKEQAPIVVQQLLTYDLIVAYFITALGLFIMMVFIHLMTKLYDVIGDEMILLTIGTIIGFIMAVANITTIIKIQVAPNLYVLDYIRALN